jgi:hypothetical protein
VSFRDALSLTALFAATSRSGASTFRSPASIEAPRPGSHEPVRGSRQRAGPHPDGVLIVHVRGRVFPTARGRSRRSLSVSGRWAQLYTAKWSKFDPNDHGGDKSKARARRDDGHGLAATSES